MHPKILKQALASLLDDFTTKGEVIVANNPLEAEFEDRLKSEGLDYRVVRALGDYAVVTVFCKPDQFLWYLNKLERELKQAEQMVERKRDSLAEHRGVV